MQTICGAEYCGTCPEKKDCGGCQKTMGHPFGGTCIAAECIHRGGMEDFLRFKKQLIAEYNALNIQGLEVADLNLLRGSYVNLAYPLKNGQTVKLLEDKRIYLGNQIEQPGVDRCYGVVADEAFLLVCEYGCNGENPELILYQKR